MAEQFETSVAKSGEILIQSILSRSKNGLKIVVKCHPKLEEFFQTQADGADNVAVMASGVDWKLPPNEDGSKNIGEAYWIHADYTGSKSLNDGSGSYRIDQLGKPILLKDDGLSIGGRGGSGRTLNLSFIRLVGLSKGIGMSFEVVGVFSRPQINEIAQSLGNGVRAFYEQYVRECKMVTTVSTISVPDVPVLG